MAPANDRRNQRVAACTGWAWSEGDGPAGHSLSSALGVAAVLSPLQGGFRLDIFSTGALTWVNRFRPLAVDGR